MAEPPGTRTLARHGPGYPAALESLPDPPALLHVAGSLAGAERAVAIVGARAATPYGIEQSRRLAGDLARLGFVVVSGLARGIDAAAHRGALEAGGRTMAVLPAGLDVVAPAHHRELAAAIAARGALLTEVAPGTGLRPGMFLRRNRLIAALGQATVVVEAAERSGALATAAVARRLGRALLVVPGDVDRPASRGCHALLRGGARLCAGAADVIAALASPPGADAPAPAATPRDRREERDAEAAGAPARLLAALGERPLALEALAGAAGVPVEEALSALLALEWSGLAVARPGQRWERA